MRPCRYICMHAHTSTHTHRGTCMQVTHTHLHAQAPACMQVHRHMHSCKYTHTHTHTHTQIHAGMCTHTHICMRKCKSAGLHTHTHTHTHTQGLEWWEIKRELYEEVHISVGLDSSPDNTTEGNTGARSEQQMAVPVDVFTNIILSLQECIQRVTKFRRPTPAPLHFVSPLLLFKQYQWLSDWCFNKMHTHTHTHTRARTHAHTSKRGRLGMKREEKGHLNHFYFELNFVVNRKIFP